jgi:hypothetical protein
MQAHAYALPSISLPAERTSQPRPQPSRATAARLRAVVPAREALAAVPGSDGYNTVLADGFVVGSRQVDPMGFRMITSAVKSDRAEPG